MPPLPVMMLADGVAGRGLIQPSTPAAFGGLQLPRPPDWGVKRL